MSVYLWVQIAGDDDNVCHIVLDADQSRCLCNEVDVVSRSDLVVYDDLGGRRPCDNCAEIAARHADARDQPVIESQGEAPMRTSA